MSKSPARKPARDEGFTLLEVLVAIFVLTVGVVSVAALAATMMATGNRSKYMSLQASLASEKLEDLNHWGPSEPQVTVPVGSSSIGSLSSDVLDATSGLAYYDDVSINFSDSTTNCPGSTSGCMAETVASESGGTTTYTTIYHSPDGRITQSSATTAPSNMTFHRRWVIEANAPVTGVRRITVQVTPETTGPQNNATFQMSLVRP